MKIDAWETILTEHVPEVILRGLAIHQLYSIYIQLDLNVQRLIDIQANVTCIVWLDLQIITQKVNFDQSKSKSRWIMQLTDA